MKSQYPARSVLNTPSRAVYWLPTLLLCLLTLLITDRASAERTTVEFNIPTQTVPAALNEFARQARVQLFFITDGFENVHANAVVGMYPRQEALQRLPDGTGLKANYTPDVLIKVAPAADSISSAILPSNTLALASVDISNDRTNGQAIDEGPNVLASQRGGGAPAANDAKNDRVREEIIVTRSRIRGARSAAPVMSITAEDIDKTGFAAVEQLIQSLPQNFSGGAGQQNSDHFPRRPAGLDIGQITDAEVSIDLRGLGSDSTLVLLHGRRLSTGGFDGVFVDISSIPVTAIERVEILTDGTVAIYGADAIAGVVNFILRDDYDGAETRLQYGADGAGNMSVAHFGQLFGKSWDKGNVIFSYEYYKQDNLLNSAPWAAAASNDLRLPEGNDWRFAGSNPGAIIAGGETYAIPARQDGTSLTSAVFVPGTQNFRHLQEGRDLMPEQECQSVYEDYGHFGDTTNPKLGILWSSTQSRDIRGTIGTSFKPSLLTQLDSTQSLNNFDTWFGFTLVPAIFLNGGNADLAAEEAATWTTGIQLIPGKLPGLDIELTYFSVDSDNRTQSAVPSFSIFLGPEKVVPAADSTGAAVLTLASAGAASGRTMAQAIADSVPLTKKQRLIESIARTLLA